jgi:hypothetical protein
LLLISDGGDRIWLERGLKQLLTGLSCPLVPELDELLEFAPDDTNPDEVDDAMEEHAGFVPLLIGATDNDELIGRGVDLNSSNLT